MHARSIPLLKYPRTPHLAGSRLQDGDDACDQVSLDCLEGAYVVIEEKLDGANSAVSFSESAQPLLQSRGHYLSGGAGERQFSALRRWVSAHEAALLERLEDRYVMYGETMTSKHSVFYDQLPHHFLEFDVYDRRTGKFLSTRRRAQLLEGSPVLSAPVLYAGTMPTSEKLLWKLIRPSLAKTAHWRETFEQVARREQLPVELCWKQTDKSDKSEGLYLKVENDEEVLARYKLVRHDFVQTILDSGSHHSRRPLFPNQTHRDFDLYATQPTVTWEQLGLRTLTSLDALKEAA